MSKVVRSIGRGISKVVKGVAGAVKKVVKSKIGRIIIAAAAIYFGGAALLGAMGTSGAAGASANIGAAWGSLGTAGSALAAGEVGTAASAIGTGFSGGVASAAAPELLGAAAAAAPAAAPAAGAAAQTAAAASPWVTSSTGLNVLASEAAPAVAGKGLLGSIMSSSPYTAPALISGGTQLLGGTLSGIGQQKALREQREYEQQMAADQRARYNQNIGTRLWGEAPTTIAPFERPELPGAQPLMPGNYQTGPMALIDQQRQGLVGSRVAMYDPRTGQYV